MDATAEPSPPSGSMPYRTPPPAEDEGPETPPFAAIARARRAAAAVGALVAVALGGGALDARGPIWSKATASFPFVHMPLPGRVVLGASVAIFGGLMGALVARFRVDWATGKARLRPAFGLAMALLVGLAGSAGAAWIALRQAASLGSSAADLPEFMRALDDLVGRSFIGLYVGLTMLAAGAIATVGALVTAMACERAIVKGDPAGAARRGLVAVLIALGAHFAALRPTGHSIVGAVIAASFAAAIMAERPRTRGARARAGASALLAAFGLVTSAQTISWELERVKNAALAPCFPDEHAVLRGPLSADFVSAYKWDDSAGSPVVWVRAEPGRDEGEVLRAVGARLAVCRTGSAFQPVARRPEARAAVATPIDVKVTYLVSRDADVAELNARATTRIHRAFDVEGRSGPGIVGSMPLERLIEPLDVTALGVESQASCTVVDDPADDCVLDLGRGVRWRPGQYPVLRHITVAAARADEVTEYELRGSALRARLARRASSFWGRAMMDLETSELRVTLAREYDEPLFDRAVLEGREDEAKTIAERVVADLELAMAVGVEQLELKDTQFLFARLDAAKLSAWLSEHVTSPGDARILLLTANAYLGRGKLASPHDAESDRDLVTAAALFARAREIGGEVEREAAGVGLGLARARLGRLDDARHAFEDLLAEMPASAGARVALATEVVCVSGDRARYRALLEEVATETVKGSPAALGVARHLALEGRRGEWEKRCRFEGDDRR